MTFYKFSKLYRKIVPEIFRVKIRNIQYVVDDLIFISEYIYFKIKNTFRFRKDVQIYNKSVCYIIPTTQITGGVAVVCEHLNRLKKLGHKTLIVSYDNKTDLSWFPNQSVKVIPLKNNKQTIEKFEIVVATGWITAYKLALLNVQRKIYFVQSNETRFYHEKSYLRNRAEHTYHFPFEYLTEAKWIKKWLKEKYNHKAELIPNGINTDIFYPDAPLQPKLKNKKRILLEGAINLPFKGMKEAFEVVQDLDCEVWCVSNDGKPKPEWRCDRFFEKVPMNMMRRIYSSCDILLKLSKVEGFFGPPLEMMACGGVSIVAKVTGYDEYIKDGYNALVIDPNNKNLIKLKIKELIHNDKMFNVLQKNSVETVKRFRWENSIKRLNNILLEKDTCQLLFQEKK